MNTAISENHDDGVREENSSQNNETFREMMGLLAASVSSREAQKLILEFEHASRSSKLELIDQMRARQRRMGLYRRLTVASMLAIVLCLFVGRIVNGSSDGSNLGGVLLSAIAAVVAGISTYKVFGAAEQISKEFHRLSQKPAKR